MFFPTVHLKARVCVTECSHFLAVSDIRKRKINALKDNINKTN
jgi:hypothetical protein